jgi:predicted peptidase
MNEFMKNTIGLLILVATATFLPMKSKAQAPAASLTSEKLSWKETGQGEMRYLRYLPKEHPGANGRRWPLMLFLHGAGERGDDLQRVAVHGPMSLVKQGTNFPFIIIAPQCPAGELWRNEPLLRLLDDVAVRLAVDTNRVYVTGLSMGGYGAWKLGLAHPERFAALVPICGGASLIDVLLGTRDKGDALKRLPIWAFHGAKDDVVSPDESTRVVQALRKSGLKEVKLTLYPEANHNSWSATYDNPELYEWLSRQSLK